MHKDRAWGAAHQILSGCFIASTEYHRHTVSRELADTKSADSVGAARDDDYVIWISHGRKRNAARSVERCADPSSLFEHRNSFSRRVIGLGAPDADRGRFC